MQSVNEWIRSLNMPVIEIARACRVSATTVYLWRDGKMKPRGSKVQMLKDFLNTYKGTPMAMTNFVPHDSKLDQVQEVINHNKALLEQNEQMMKMMMGTLKEVQSMRHDFENQQLSYMEDDKKKVHFR